MGRLLKLSPQEAAFCSQFLLTGDATQAYEDHLAKPGAKRTSSASGASRTLNKPHIQHHIEHLRSMAVKKVEEDHGNLLTKGLTILAEVARKGMETFVDGNGARQYHSLPAARAAASDMIKVHQADNDGTVKLQRAKLIHELADKGKISDDTLELMIRETMGHV